MSGDEHSKKVNDFWLWIDNNLNHGFFEKLVSWSYWLWRHTSYKFCIWVCDNFETFNIK
jgi:hypothetical protein